MSDEAPVRRSLLRNSAVIAFGVVSFLTDASSEMIAPFLPFFVVSVLGGGPGALGWVEGAAAATAALLKLVSGRVTDRRGNRRFALILGYVLSGLTRPVIALATAPWHVLVVRVTDRIGKGIRSSPRDALLAASVPPSQRGAAFSLHQAFDHAGAVVGPLLALAVLWVFPGDFRMLFAFAAFPGVLATIAVVIGARAVAEEPPSGEVKRVGWPDAQMLRFLVPLAVFTLGNATDAFLLLRAGGDNPDPTRLCLLWAAFHLVKVVASPPLGALSDRLGRRLTIGAGWIVYALVYAGFALTDSPVATVALFLVYGLYYAATEGAEKAFVANLAPKSERGTAFGWYSLVTGGLALPASVLFGALWAQVGAPAAFGVGAGLAALATVGLLFVPAPPPPLNTG